MFNLFPRFGRGDGASGRQPERKTAASGHSAILANYQSRGLEEESARKDLCAALLASPSAWTNRLPALSPAPKYGLFAMRLPRALERARAALNPENQAPAMPGGDLATRPNDQSNSSAHTTNPPQSSKGDAPWDSSALG